MHRRRPIAVAAVVVSLAACGGGGGTDGAADPTAAPSDPAPRTGPKQASAPDGGSPFDLSVLGPEWNAKAEPFEPAEARPSDCPHLDRARADFRRWAITERAHRVAGTLVLELTARAPGASDAKALLALHERLSNECPIIRYVNGGTSTVEPASGRVNQAVYTVRHEQYEPQLETVTIKGEWIVEVTVLGYGSEHASLRDAILRTLQEQSLE